MSTKAAALAVILALMAPAALTQEEEESKVTSSHLINNVFASSSKAELNGNRNPRPRIRVFPQSFVQNLTAEAAATDSPSSSSSSSSSTPSRTEKLAKARDSLSTLEPLDEGVEAMEAILQALKTTSTVTPSTDEKPTFNTPAFVLPAAATRHNARMDVAAAEELPVALPQRSAPTSPHMAPTSPLTTPPLAPISYNVPEFLTRSVPRYVSDQRSDASILSDGKFNNQNGQNGQRILVPRSGAAYRPPQNVRESPRSSASIPKTSSKVPLPPPSPYDRSQSILPSSPLKPASAAKSSPSSPAAPSTSSNKAPAAQPYHRTRFASPYDDDDYYSYDYDYEYSDSYHKYGKRPLVTKAKLPSSDRKSKPSTLYPTYQKPPRSHSYPATGDYGYHRRNPASSTYRKRPTRPAILPRRKVLKNNKIFKKNGSGGGGGGSRYRNRGGQAPPPPAQASATRHYEPRTGSAGGGVATAASEDEEDYYYDDEEYYDDYYVSGPPRRRNGANARNSGYGGGGSSINPLALLVAPLASIALLGAAAAVALNPVLVSVSLTTAGKKRRKRSLFGLEDMITSASNDDAAYGNSTHLEPEVQAKIKEMQVLERFLGSVPTQVKYQQQILSMYLSCSGYLEDSNLCLDRVVCEYSDKQSNLHEDERDVVAIYNKCCK